MRQAVASVVKRLRFLVPTTTETVDPTVDFESNNVVVN